jgi:hypothetical protein
MKTTNPYAVSLDPNQPNKLPGPLRLATKQEVQWGPVCLRKQEPSLGPRILFLGHGKIKRLRFTDILNSFPTSWGL